MKKWSKTETVTGTEKNHVLARGEEDLETEKQVMENMRCKLPAAK